VDLGNEGKNAKESIIAGSPPRARGDDSPGSVFTQAVELEEGGLRVILFQTVMFELRVYV